MNDTVEASKNLNDTTTTAPIGHIPWDTTDFSNPADVLQFTEKHVPKCAEKFFQILSIHCADAMARRGGDEPPTAATSAEFLTESRFLDILSDGEQCLRDERLDDAESTQQIRRIRELIPAYFGDQQKATDSQMANLVGAVLSKIRPLNMDLMCGLVCKTEATAARIAGKSILLLLGKTGAGKSTTVHFLAGSTLYFDDEDGDDHIAVEICAPDLCDVTTSASSRSVTRYVSAVRLDATTEGRHEVEDLFVCDTPGFEDTDGPEVDIANGIGLVNAVKQAKQVRPVLLFSQLGLGDRPKVAVLSMAKTLDMLLANMNTDLQHFSYIFTKYDKRKEKTLCKTFQRWANEIGEDRARDHPLQEFLLKNMISKAQNGAIVLEPLDDKPSEIISRLTPTSIEVPEHAFRIFVSPDSLAKLSQQFSILQRSTRLLLDVSCINTELLAYRLHQMSTLASFNLPSLTPLYADSVREVSEYIHAQLQDVDNQLKVYMDDGNTAISDDLQECLRSLSALWELESIRLVYLPSVVNLQEAVDNLLFRNQHALCERVTAQVNAADEANAVRLDKMKLVAEGYQLILKGAADQSDEVPHKYQVAMQHIACEIQKLASNMAALCPPHSNGFNFDEAISVLSTLDKARTTFANHLDRQMMEDAFHRATDTLVQSLEDVVNQAQAVLQSPDILLGDDGAAHLKCATASFRAARSTRGFSLYIADEFCQEQETRLLEAIQQFLETARTPFFQPDVELKDLLQSTAKCLLTNINVVVGIVQLERFTNEYYYATHAHLNEQLQKVSMQCTGLLQQIMSGNGDANEHNLNHFTECLQIVALAACELSEFHQQYLNIAKDLHTKLTAQVQIMCKQAKSHRFQLADAETVEMWLEDRRRAEWLGEAISYSTHTELPELSFHDCQTMLKEVCDGIASDI